VFGKYTIQAGTSNRELIIHVDASIGAAEWHDGETMQHLIARADTTMYQIKRESYRDSASLTSGGGMQRFLITDPKK
jgi:hypothetical protein